jgi:hypothetical protein
MMDGQQFVDLLKLVVRDSAASQELSVLQNPPGRRPSQELLDRSKWYNSLADDKKKILSSIIMDVADRAVFGFLCVIDGARAIENHSQKGHLELHYINDKSVVLNPPEGEALHELW